MSPQRTLGGFPLVGRSAILRKSEPPEYLVANVIPRGAVVMLGGFGGGYKSFLALDLALAVDQGTTWLDNACMPGSVVYIAWEGNESDLSRRTRVLLTGRKQALRKFDLCVQPHVDFGNDAFAGAMHEVAENAHLVIIDSFAAANSQLDENSAAARRPMDILGKIAQATGCTFVVIHHAPKAGARGRKVNDRREGLRGSGSIFDAADAVLMTSLRPGNAKHVLIEHTKSRFGPMVPDRVVTLAAVEGTIGGEAFTAVSTVGTSESRADTLLQIEAAILEHVKTNAGCSMTSLDHAKLGARAELVRSVRDGLLQQGKLVNRQKGKTSQLFI